MLDTHHVYGIMNSGFSDINPDNGAPGKRSPWPRRRRSGQQPCAPHSCKAKHHQDLYQFSPCKVRTDTGLSIWASGRQCQAVGYRSHSITLSSLFLFKRHHHIWWHELCFPPILVVCGVARKSLIVRTFLD